jgi:hypothetical protein
MLRVTSYDPSSTAAQVFTEAGLRGLNKKETLDAPGASPSL